MSSYISRESISVAIPDVKEARASFVYNFYEIDESSPSKHARNAPIIRPRGGDAIPNVQNDLSNNNFLTESPRYVEISFEKSNPPNWADTKINTLKERFGNIFDESRGVFITDFPVQSEIDINTRNWKGIEIQDVGITSRLQDLVMTELEKIFPGNIHTMQLSQTDMTKALNDATSGKVSGSIINALVSDYSSDGVTYYDRSNKDIKNELFTDAAGVKFEIQFDQKFAGDAIKIMTQDALSPTNKNLFLTSRLESEKQSAARNTIASISSDDYKPNVVCIETSLASTRQMPLYGVCGYVIDKFVMTPSGGKEYLQSFFLQGSMTTSYIDTRVAYGFSYIYEIKTLSLIEMNVDGDYFDQSSNSWQVILEPRFAGGVLGLESFVPRSLFAVLSRPTRQIVVNCQDSVAPPPPDLLTFRFDYSIEKLIIEWKFPHTKQRDVKKFQVFKRRSIYEGFTLIAQYDFSDAIFEVPPIERIIQEVDFRALAPVTHHVDEDFDKNGDAIYAVVSVDAHNLTSNYSDQIRVRFDRTKNIIETTSISPLGAPKQYPNFLISSTDAQNIETIRYTEDVMKDSGHKKMRIYLDPEVLYIERDAGGVDSSFANLVVSDDSLNRSLGRGAYKFQILNIDRQKSKILDVSVLDRRASL